MDVAKSQTAAKAAPIPVEALASIEDVVAPGRVVRIEDVEDEGP
ncbi:hypothetical protein [Streptomyces aureoverticillatus]|nr:hypothetical protein [Streptomyces aureoverticillatus]